MSEQLVTQVNDAQARWKQTDAEVQASQRTYTKHLQVSYEILKEYTQRQTDLLVALLSQRSQPAPTEEPLRVSPASAEELEPKKSRLDNISE